MYVYVCVTLFRVMWFHFMCFHHYAIVVYVYSVLYGFKLICYVSLLYAFLMLCSLLLRLLFEFILCCFSVVHAIVLCIVCFNAVWACSVLLFLCVYDLLCYAVACCVILVCAYLSLYRIRHYYMLVYFVCR